jgi:aminoglycoside phosphotransferase (APT) family kinase protein
MDNVIARICQKEGLDARKIQPVSGGQVNQVFLIDDRYILRIGGRENAGQRLKAETELIQRLATQAPVARVYAFGQEGDQVYQIQQYVQGKKLYTIWNQLSRKAQDRLAGELAEYLKLFRQITFEKFGFLYDPLHQFDSWQEFLAFELNRSLAEFQALGISTFPGMLDLAKDFFENNRAALAGGAATLVHGDLWMGNILVDQGKISAILDFEYAMQAPADFELFKMEDFCLYPNDYAEEEGEDYCAGDFAGFFHLLRRHDPDLFATGHLRTRMSLYQIESALSDALAWRKDNLDTIPPDSLKAKEFYMARISNAIFRNGVRLF